MVPFFVLIISILVFRGIGLLGIDLFSTWQDSTRYALSVMFLITASAHFTKMKTDLVNMVPKSFKYPKQIVFVTGILEIAGAVGLLISSIITIAGLCLSIMMIAMFPANYFAAKNGITLNGKAPTPLWLRLPMQLIFIGLTLWSTNFGKILT